VVVVVVLVRSIPRAEEDTLSKDAEYKKTRAALKTQKEQAKLVKLASVVQAIPSSFLSLVLFFQEQLVSRMLYNDNVLAVEAVFIENSCNYCSLDVVFIPHRQIRSKRRKWWSRPSEKSWSKNAHREREKERARARRQIHDSG
jgi:hypothetical protein